MARPIPPGEWKRKAVHAATGLFALTFRWLDWKAAAAVAAAALLFNLFAMPRLGRGLYRDSSRRRDPGIVAYAVMVLVLVLLLRDHYLPVAAAGWAMMAFGDPAAAVAGDLLGGARLPWNRSKRWIGLLANWAAGSTASIAVFRFVSARPLELVAVFLLVAGSAVYAFLESVRAGIDDNLVAALPTALADTLGTEVGTLFGRSPRSPLSFRRLEPGTPGAVSRAGTAAAFAGAAVIALSAWLFGWAPRGVVLAVLAGGFLGALAESVLADLGRRFGFRPDHEFANAFNTFAGGLIALEIVLSLEKGGIYWPVAAG